MRVMISCDDATLTKALCRTLAGLPFHCEVTKSLSVGEMPSALAVEPTPPDVLIVALPGASQVRSKAVTQLRSLTDAWIVAIGHARDATEIIDLLQQGADGFVDEHRDLAPQLLAILENRRRHAGIDDKAPSRLIGVTSSTGGCGGSTLSTNVAVSLAESAESCGLFDFDLEKGDLAHLLNLKPRHSILDLCRNSNLVDQSMLRQSLVHHESGVNLLAAPDTIGGGQNLDESKLQRILRVGASLFPNCVVDLGCPANLFRHTELIGTCSKILVVLKLDFTGLCNARRVLDFLERENVTPSKIVIVANRRGMPGELPANKAKGILGRGIDHCVPCDEAAANFAVNCGVPLVQESPKSRIAKAIRSLSHSLVETAPQTRPAKANAIVGRRPISSGFHALQKMAWAMVSAKPTVELKVPLAGG